MNTYLQGTDVIGASVTEREIDRVLAAERARKAKAGPSRPWLGVALAVGFLGALTVVSIVSVKFWRGFWKERSRR